MFIVFYQLFFLRGQEKERIHVQTQTHMHSILGVLPRKLITLATRGERNWAAERGRRMGEVAPFYAFVFCSTKRFIFSIGK